MIDLHQSQLAPAKNTSWRQYVGPSLIGIGFLTVIVFLFWLPHALRRTGIIESKQWVRAWDELHPEVFHPSREVYHWGYDETRKIGPNRRVVTHHEGWTEHISAYTTPAWIEHHPDQFWLHLADGKGDVDVDAALYAAAEAGDVWAASGFYGTHLVKTKLVEQ